MTIEKLGKVLHGQVPFADTDGKGKQRYRWYAACDAWQPDSTSPCGTTSPSWAVGRSTRRRSTSSAPDGLAAGRGRTRSRHETSGLRGG